MEKYMMVLTLMTIFLLTFPLVFSLEVENCASNDEDWECELDETCFCEIEGDCTNGNLLVYKYDISNLLCMPEIEDNEVEFSLDSCGSPTGKVKVRADCDEGQSDEEKLDVIVFQPIITTTEETTTTIEETSTTTTTIEEELEPCPLDYECCEDEYPYEDELCPVGMECIDHVCVEEEAPEGGFNYGLIAGILVVIIVVFLIYSFFIKKKGKMSFKKLYEKWT